MFPEEKLNAMRTQLKSEFPSYDICEESSHDIKFRLVLQNKSNLVTFCHEFIMDNDALYISNYLQRHSLRKLFQREDVVEVIVTNRGIKRKLKGS